MDIKQVTETIAMIEEQNFDVRTITMGISLLDCIDSDIDKAAEKVYNKIVSKAKNLVAVGDGEVVQLPLHILRLLGFSFTDQPSYFLYQVGVLSAPYPSDQFLQ